MTILFTRPGWETEFVYANQTYSDLLNVAIAAVNYSSTFCNLPCSESLKARMQINFRV